MRYIALFGHGPNWKQGSSVYEQGPPIEGHLESMRRHFEAGVLLLGGPFERGGGIAVLDVADEADALEIMDADPAVAAGVLTYTLHGHHAYFDAFTGSGTQLTVGELAGQRGRD